MTVVYWIAAILLTLAAWGAIYRVWVGPTLLDRVLASDVLLTIIVAALCLNMVITRSYEAVLLLVVIAMIGFVGSVTVARFADNSRMDEKPQKPLRQLKIPTTASGRQSLRVPAKIAPNAFKKVAQANSKNSNPTVTGPTENPAKSAEEKG